MRRTAGLLSLLAVLLVGCGQAAEPEKAAPPPPAPATSQPVVESFDLAAALAQIEAAGYTPTPPDGELAGPVRVIQAMCTGSANGRCQALFFFDGQRLAQQTGDIGMMRILSQDGTAVRVEFPVYNADDPGCCPSGTPTQHTIRLVGDQLQADPPISTNPNRPGD
ncbi:LppP/LprE lipoprotein [Saccharopolyspora kobensis]|uniref:LppP/LprE lipoprotein n=1 Tax=Saccharopolyspora kobensis TaxID=146035 RepID=A0A1H6DH08_9PSEU|nr:LppP/LprE family lipoprotein [Saccharopolyspora kobensis]SEG83886.1 LppP/LprE lipoprotein [Saccharopolyspora kobensis]SFE34303.1 LppP/LprE lipoprotein [Saccharopolyspora kobensis]